ncbi:hypothetical protein C5748_16160 [Phyllobacterium phragmitis]|uniref:Uncharacterized protein n=1 Tax=Phyllobacterium phragmitis TaxID=2670329 RepID=A0A2S9IP93_9HYPH|nr:hypothetical protein [Phyllobacterium phragmitis]PRD42330.1 hypothetical protein C5748_16160 [Phyllobacterium phragmitis]
MAETPNFKVPLPNPSGIQREEVQKIADALTAFDEAVKQISDERQARAEKGQANGYAGLDENAVVPDSQLQERLLQEFLDDRFARRTAPTIQTSLTVEGTMSATGAITSAGSPVLTQAMRGAADGVAPLGADTKIPEAYLPAVAITDTYVVSSQAQMLALNVQRGDIAVRSDINKCFVLARSPATSFANWVELRTPSDAVLSVAGRTGAVALVIGDIGGLQAALNAKLNLTGGTITGSLTTTGNAFQVKNNGNRHFWFTDADGNEKGLLYSDTASGAMRIRVAGSRYFNFNTNGEFEVNSLRAASGTITNFSASTVSSTGNITAKRSDLGGARLVVAGGTPGRVEFLKPDGTRAGYIGHASGTRISHFADNGFIGHRFNGDIVVQGRVHAADGDAYLNTDGNVVGSGWSDWGSTNAKAAISARIELRAREFADDRKAAAIAAIMPTITGITTNGVGCVAILKGNGPLGSIAPNTIIAGSSLIPVAGTALGGNGGSYSLYTPSGTWRYLGPAYNDTSSSSVLAGLFRRIA